ncbi:uncharacterized protein LOC110444726, partial [Mizuhopecten yessoensis]|uniref:uncharacterized protein LOC110444726 n=1 Tax=Mizuhopecten yessoensis TaxID=6573 RepID=UPI000B457CD5
LVGTVALRFEIQVTLALVFAIIALKTSSVSMREKEGLMEPLVVTCSALSHLVAAILLGVTLGAYAQQLHQISRLGDIYTMMKVTDQGYGFLVLGFVAVLVSILLAVTHLLVLVSNLKKQEERKPDVEYNLLVQNEDSP